MSYKTASLTAAFTGLVMMAGSGAHALDVTYDFKAAADGTLLGESAWGVMTDVFTTTVMTTDGDAGSPLVGGPGFNIWGKKSGADAFAYLDRGNAGMGVCGVLESGASTGAQGDSGTNLCDPSSDDGLTTTGEVLFFEALSDMYVLSIDVNSNHDPADITSTIWEINGVEYDLASYTKAPDGDVTIDLGGFRLNKDFNFDVLLTQLPNSYVSSITVAAVPLPAAAWMLLGVSGALVAAKRRKARRAA